MRSRIVLKWCNMEMNTPSAIGPCESAGCVGRRLPGQGSTQEVDGGSSPISLLDPRRHTLLVEPTVLDREMEELLLDQVPLLASAAPPPTATLFAHRRRSRL